MNIKFSWKDAVLGGAILCCLLPIVSPSIALLAGVVLTTLKCIPKNWDISSIASMLLKGSIICLGFGLQLEQAIETSKQGFLLSTGSICVTFLLGWIFFRLMNTEKTTSYLVSTGTAICGGSAIAAVSPILEASQKQLSFSLGVVFMLNAIALLVFPAIGFGLGLTQAQFGYWAAIAIHDTSSVVGAAASYGAEALDIATTVKLTRALWIIPVSLIFSRLPDVRKSGTIKVPWFILLFCLAIMMRYFIPEGIEFYNILTLIGKKGMVVTLLLIGAGISFKQIKEIGSKNLFYGVLLWISISVLSLVVIQFLVN
ncbi:MAG: putative sulfate exporter family transporter [Balneola sp.]